MPSFESLNDNGLKLSMFLSVVIEGVNVGGYNPDVPTELFQRDAEIARPFFVLWLDRRSDTLRSWYASSPGVVPVCPFLLREARASSRFT